MNKLYIFLFYFLMFSKYSFADEGDFINAVKNLNLQEMNVSENIAPVKEGKPVGDSSNVSSDMEKKNILLQQKYNKLLGNYNKLIASEKCKKCASHEDEMKNLSEEKNTLQSENITLHTQISKITSDLNSINHQHELSASAQKKERDTMGKENVRLMSEAESTRKQLAETTAALTALRQQNELSVSAQKKERDTMGKENARLMSEAESTRKRLAETTAALTALRQQNELSVSAQKKEIDTIGKENARLMSEVESTHKQLAKTTAALTALRQQNELSVSAQKKERDTMGKENARLLSEAESTRKRLAETTAALTALRQQNELSVSAQKKEIDTIGKENARLMSEVESTRKKLAEVTSSLTALKNEAEIINNEKSSLLKTVSGKNSYSLGVFYFDKINDEFKKIRKNNIELTPSMMIAGINDAYNNTLQLKKTQIMENVVKTDQIIQAINSDYSKKILKLIKNKKYEVLANGSFLVTEKATTRKYEENDVIYFDMLEKSSTGKPILNTMNTKVHLREINDQLLRKVIEQGGKGGVVTLYGKAVVLYRNLPDGVSDDDLILITFKLN
ncbi:TPA: hypothetical protein R4302_005351 [Klebsiella oxytoca]|nr:hypothetical protein [Klebsiella oxytoca]